MTVYIKRERKIKKREVIEIIQGDKKKKMEKRGEVEDAMKFPSITPHFYYSICLKKLER